MVRRTILLTIILLMPDIVLYMCCLRCCLVIAYTFVLIRLFVYRRGRVFPAFFERMHPVLGQLAWLDSDEKITGIARELPAILYHLTVRSASCSFHRHQSV